MDVVVTDKIVSGRVCIRKGYVTDLERMLKPNPIAPKIMKVSFRPMLGTKSAIFCTRSNLVRVKIPVSQNAGPAENR